MLDLRLSCRSATGAIAGSEASRKLPCGGLGSSVDDPQLGERGEEDPRSPTERWIEHFNHRRVVRMQLEHATASTGRSTVHGLRRLDDVDSDTAWGTAIDLMV